MCYFIKLGGGFAFFIISLLIRYIDTNSNNDIDGEIQGSVCKIH